MIGKVTTSQLELCQRFGVEPLPAPGDRKAGVSRSVWNGVRPLNGLRHPPDFGTTGWFIWAGDTLSEEPNFFEPVHVSHLVKIRPEIVPYLALPPGWRFLIAGMYEDVWEDSSFLNLG